MGFHPDFRLAGVLFILLLAEGSALAGGFSVTTFGSRRTGMLANIAAPDDLTALYHNPAALADQPGLRLHLSNSVSFLGTSFRLQALDADRFPEVACEDVDACAWPVDSRGYYTRRIEPLSTMGVLPYVGISQDLGVISPALRDVVLSAAITAPNFYAGRMPGEGPSAYFFVEGYFLVISSMLGAGWRINDWLAIGGTVMYNYMRLSYSQLFSLADLLMGRDGSGNPLVASMTQTMIGDVRMDYGGLDHGVGWTLSALFSPTSWLSVGVSYNDATDGRFNGDVDLSPSRTGVTREELITTAESFGFRLPDELIVEMPIPPFISAGVSFRPSRTLEIGFDSRLWLYNVYKKQVLIPVYHTTEGKAPFTEDQLSRQKNYNLSYDLSLGVLLRPLPSVPPLQLLAGVGFDKSPVPDDTFTIDNPSMDNYRFALGVRWFPERGWRAALTYTYMGYLERDVTTSKANPPLNARGEGTNQFPRLEIEYVF